MGKREVVFVDGVRTPFLKAQTDFKNLSAYDLGRFALGGLIRKTVVDGEQIGHVYFGNVLQDVNTNNVAREIALASGIPGRVPATTISMACISSNAAITAAVESIQSGQINSAVAGGVEALSDLPIRYRKPLRQKLLETQKYRKPADWLSFFKGLKPSDLLPEIPSISEYSTGDTMGESCDKMAAKYGVSRVEQDAYALRSHQTAFKAAENGLFKEEIVPVYLSEIRETIARDNGVRSDTSMEALGKLNPAFIRPHGTVTAGNASFLTDGASASLLMERKFAEAGGFLPKAIIRSYTYVARKPGDELLLGPAFAIPEVLGKMNLKMEDIDVFEFHEAFAGQMVTVLKALASVEFASERLHRNKAAGAVPIKKLNTRGGSLSLGHPFGATGVRLVSTAANRLIKEKGRYALIAACAAGGQGHAMIIERYVENSSRSNVPGEDSKSKQQVKDEKEALNVKRKGQNDMKGKPAGNENEKKNVKSVKRVKGQGGDTI